MKGVEEVKAFLGSDGPFTLSDAMDALPPSRVDDEALLSVLVELHNRKIELHQESAALNMEVKTLDDKGHKKVKKRDSKSEKRRRKNKNKKQMSKSDSLADTPNESAHEEGSSNGIAGSKPSEDGDGQDDDIPEKDGSSQESLKPSTETPFDRSEKTIRAVEDIFRRARMLNSQTE